MGALVNIISVGGVGPSYVLTVDNSGGAISGDHVACATEALPVDDGGLYRVTGVPDGSTIEVEDDLKAPPYGKPGGGPAQFYTPTARQGLSQLVDKGPYWAEAQRRDMRIADDPSSGLGDPPPGKDYADEFFDTWTPSTLIGHAAFNISEAFNDLAPAKAGVLDGQSLVIVGTTYYNAKLPNGLTAAWNPYTPGDTIGNLVVDGTYNMSTPDTGTRFRAGKASDNPSSAGQVAHVLQGLDNDVHDLAGSGPGITGFLQVTALDVYNTFWLKANAQINYIQTAEGRVTHAIRAWDAVGGDAGVTNTLVIYFDDENPAPSFSVPLSHVVTVEQLKYLSGIAYYTTGTTLRATFTAGSGIFRKAYHPTQVARLSVPGAANKTLNPSSVPSVDDTFPISGADGDIVMSTPNQASNSPQLEARLYKPNGANTVDTDALARRVCTYGVVSTNVGEYFYDEANRLVLGTTTPWTSSDPLVNGNAQVLNGSLMHGADGDYPGFSGDQEYQRRIAKVSASGGVLALSGISHSDIDPYGTGDLNVLLWLEDDDRYFDLGRVVGDNNGTGSGDSRSNSLGSKVSGSGSNVTFSLLTYTTGDNNNRYRVIIIFRATGNTITQMVGT